jgi:ABC-2 type transport system ATP-binding protein
MNFNVEVNNLSLKYKKFEALKNISFKLENGKVYGLLGRNGAGKTSLLSVLSSFRKATEGNIKISGEEPYENAEIMKNIAFHYETNYKEDTTKVKTMLKFVKMFRPNYDEKYAQYLVELFKLPLNKPVNKLSKGMQSSLEVTMGLASRSPITIFDETYLGMDAPTRVKFYEELLRDQSNHPRIFILSTHLVSEMDYLFDEILILHNGQLMLHEEYETLTSKGINITGQSDVVDAFIKGKKVLNIQQLGNTKTVMLFEERTDIFDIDAISKGLIINPVSLQDLFIHMTEEVEM